MGEELKVPEEIADIMDEHLVCIACRDKCINSFFKAKRAIYYGKQARKAERKFWAMVYKLYPQIKTDEKDWRYNFNDKVLRVSE